MTEAEINLRIHRREGRREGLYGKWQAEEDRSDDQPLERKSQRVSGNRLPPAANRTARTQRNQQKVAKHGRRQHQGQCDQRLDQELPAPARVGDPVGDRHPNDQKHAGDDHRQAQCQQERIPVHGPIFL